MYISRNDHLKFRTSLIKAYLKCPAMCFFRYFKGLVILPKSFHTMGSCTHSTAEYSNKCKVRKGKEPKLSVLQDVFYEHFKVAKRKTQWTKQEDPHDFEKEGIKLIVPAYHNKIAKRIEPKYAEESFRITFEDLNFSITGTIDVIEKDNMIRDLKTKSRTPSWTEVINSFQGKSYRVGFRSRFKKDPKGFVLDYLIRKQEPEVFSSKVIEPSSKDELEFKETCNFVARCIRLGMFYPRREGNFNCSPNSCGYWSMCKRGEWRTLGPYTGIVSSNDGTVEKGEL